jgi:general secretion pathway protein I
MQGCRTRKNRGFTLIEVMVALAIVAIGMVAVIQAVGQTASNAAYLRDKTVAHWIAMNQLTLMRLGLAPAAEGKSSGDVEMADQRWKWSAEVTQTPVASMKRIDVAVRYADAPDDSQLTIVSGFIGDKVGKPGTIIAQYTPAPAGQRSTP